MASTNFGQQLITFSYGQQATSDTFNRLMYKLFPKGIYEGAVLSQPDPNLNRVSISPGVFYFHDPDYTEQTDETIAQPLVEGLGIKIQTLSAITDIEVTSTDPYIVLRYTWQNTSGNYADIQTKAFADIDSDKDIIIGRAQFLNNVLQDTFDYTRRDEPEIAKLEANQTALKVLSDEGSNPQKVYVNAGEAVINNQRVSWPGGVSTSALSTNVSSGDERTDIVYLREDGTVQFRLGQTSTIGDSQAPQYPTDGVVLAEITRGHPSVKRETIEGMDITQIDIERNITKNLEWGTDLSDEINSTYIPIGSAINESVTGGTDYSIAETVNVRDAIEDVIQNVKTGAGIDDGAIDARHVNFNASDVSISVGNISAGNVADAISGLADGSEIDNDAIDPRHINFQANDIPVNGYSDVQAGIDSLEGNISSVNSNKLNNTTDTLSGTLTITNNLYVNGRMSCSSYTTSISDYDSGVFGQLHFEDGNSTYVEEYFNITLFFVRMFFKSSNQSGYTGDVNLGVEQEVNGTWSLIFNVPVNPEDPEHHGSGGPWTNDIANIDLHPGRYRLVRRTGAVGGGGLFSDDLYIVAHPISVSGIDYLPNNESEL